MGKIIKISLSPQSRIQKDEKEPVGKQALKSVSKILSSPSDVGLKINTSKIGNFPYVKARTVKSEHRRKSGSEIRTEPRWYILFYAWDADKHKLVQKRLEKGINTVKDQRARESHCRQLCREINQALEDGYHFYKDEEEKEQRSRSEIITTKKALEYVLESKKRTVESKTYDAYNFTVKMFIEYLEKRGKIGCLPQELTPADIILFRDFILKTYPQKNVSVNNKMSYLRTLFYDVQARGWIDKNPCKDQRRLKEEEHERFLSFSKAELTKVKEYLEKFNPYLWKFAQVIFHSFARPAEVRQITVKDVLFDKNQIYIPAKSSKTGKARYVDITPPLLSVLESMELKDQNRDHYIFTIRKRPGPEPMAKDTFSKAFTKNIKRLGFKEGYSLYSLKHTGVEQYFMAGADIKWIQHQCGHADIETTDRYLKRLGLHRSPNGIIVEI